MKRLFLDSMFEFRGRKLNILPELLSDNMRFRGCPLSEERAKNDIPVFFTHESLEVAGINTSKKDGA